MEHKILEQCLIGMSAYKKAEETSELLSAIDVMADADEVDAYFNEKND